ncbi:MAG: hypothetical protein SGJ09_11725 [Phycisphaerae bacterium]|nr:hypothetical protein [Phycisphaerae bacterium]
MLVGLCDDTNEASALAARGASAPEYEERAAPSSIAAHQRIDGFANRPGAASAPQPWVPYSQRSGDARLTR